MREHEFYAAGKTRLKKSKILPKELSVSIIHSTYKQA